MCGIAGFTTLDRNAPPDRIEQLIRAIHHRGPDQRGVHRAPWIALGAVRLSIIDLAGGDQPIRTVNGDSVIVFNGEVYNHAEIRRELESRGVHFETRCDTEVVLYAFLEWGVAGFAKLRGMFAAAIWTESQKRLVLVRDRMGIKPLYFSRRGRDLYFGSELKAILENDEIPRIAERRALSHYLSLNYIPCPLTMVKGVEKLPPGHWLEWREGVVRSGSYWKLRFAPDANITLDEAKEELDVLMRDAVREHLIADVPLGVWASGGLDSTAVLHYAAREVPRLKTFSVGFRGRTFDESPYFREVAGAYSTEHHEFDLNPEQDLPETIEKLAWYSDEPSADAGALPVWFLSQMTRRHVKVALSGEGADELFGGYYTYLADRYARWLGFVPSFVRQAGLGLLNRIPASDDKISFEFKAKRLLEGSLLPPDEAHLFWNGTSSAEQKRRLCHVPQVRVPLPDEAPSTGRLNQYLWLDQLLYLPDDILYKCDRMSMAHSLEVRPPFLDHRIVEFAARLPENLKIRGSQLKFVLRELMRGKVPEAVLTRKKEGFDIPAHHWFRTILKPMLLDVVNERAVRQSGIFEWPEVSRLIGRHMDRKGNYGYHLWGLLILFLWKSKWKIAW